MSASEEMHQSEWDEYEADLFFERYVQLLNGNGHKEDIAQLVSDLFLEFDEKSERTVNSTYRNKDGTDEHLCHFVDFTKRLDLECTKPISYSFFGKEKKTTSWEDLYIGVCKALFRNHRYAFEKIIRDTKANKCRLIVADKDLLSRIHKKENLGPYYLVLKLSSTDYVHNIKLFLDECGVDYGNLKIKYYYNNEQKINNKTFTEAKKLVDTQTEAISPISQEPKDWIITELKNRGISYKDLRADGLCLWILGNENDLASFVSECNQQGYNLRYSPNGCRWFPNKPVWWTRQRGEKGSANNEKSFQNSTNVQTRSERIQEKLKRLEEVPSAEIMICVRFDDDKSNEDFIIASDRQDTNNKKAFHYTDEIGRELLSSAYATQRMKRGKINGKNYSVIDCLYPDSKRKHLSGHIIPTSLIIRKDGGYHNSIEGNEMEIVHILLYSPFTDRYEIICSTLDKKNDIYFVDIQLYRKYVEKYGYPDCSVKLNKQTNNSEMCFDDLNAESILKEVGYSVNEKDGFSPRARQELLADIVDLQILSVSNVVSYLDWFIRSHPNPKDTNARYKWNEDKTFIQNYKVNPERFFIAKNIKRQ